MSKSEPSYKTIAEMKKHYVKKALKRSKDRKTAAKMLGITEPTLRKLINQNKDE